MQPLPEPSSREGGSSVELLAIKTFINSRTSVLRLQGQYTFEDLKTVEPVACSWEIRQEAAGLSVRGQIKATVTLECARCLEPFDVPVIVELDELYVLNRYVDTTERERELQADDFYEVVDEEGELDLKDLAHQFLVMELSEQSSCGRPECRIVNT